jgi:hypothetical protein
MRDIAEDDEIRACLEEAGFDPGLAGMGMLAGAEEYTRNLEDAVNAGAFGAPFYIVDGDREVLGTGPDRGPRPAFVGRLVSPGLHVSGGRRCAAGLPVALHAGPWRRVETDGAAAVGPLP